MFNVRAILYWFTTPLLYAFIIVKVVFLGEQAVCNSEGKIMPFMASGMTVFACCIFVANLKIYILTYTASIGLVGSIFIGIILLYFASAMAEWIFPFGNLPNILSMQVGSMSYWGSIVASVGVIFIFEVFLKRYGSLL